MTRKKKIKLTAILGSIMIVLLALIIAASVLMNAYSTMMGEIFGKGEMTVSDTSGLDGAYYEYECDSTDESLAYAQSVTQEVVEEGAVLLQNQDNALPLTTNAKVTLFGYYALHPNMSGGEDPRTTEGAHCFDDGFELAGLQVNPTTVAFYESCTDEVSPTEYTQEMEDSYAEYSDAAVVVIKRNSGEGSDQTIKVDTDNGRTGLSISSTELDIIQYACDRFDTVIVVINSANAMELGFTEGGSYTDKYTGKTYDFTNLKAAIWCGGLGSQGAISVGNIINGNVNPSGHLVDTYVRDLTLDPTYQNFGNYEYTNASEAGSYQDRSYFVEYEEGIYVGYKYYETAAYEASQGNYDGFDYDEQVVYPFGYGLSYTTFDMEYDGTPTYDETTDEYTFNVKITNTGSVAGKGVAQIYVNVPYITGGVEKAHVQLVGYAKSSELEAGASETVTITVKRDYFTAYDDETEKCYILDAGDYNFLLCQDAHDWTEIDTSDSARCWTQTIDSKIVYDSDNKRTTDLVAAVNTFDEELSWKFKDYTENEAGSGYATKFTRANFKDSFPTAPEGDDYVASEYVLETLAIYDPTAEEEQTVTEYPVTDSTTTSYTLADMRGVDYDDPKWDDFISQFSVSSMLDIFTNGGWELRKDVSNGVPASYDMDSPYGYYSHANPPENINKWYQSAPVTAATWNTDMAYNTGDALAEEAQAQRYSSGNFIITGIYGPGLNTHRSAFGGRNYEYFSEDAVLSGTMAAAECSALGNKGMITYMKHYVLNEQETNRQNNGYCVWLTEQALRETYNRGFEIYVKEAKMTVNYYTDEDGDGTYEMTSKEMSAATAIMTAYNRVGAVWAGASEAVTVLLRQEAGFTGISLTDAGGGADEYMNSDLGIRTGGTDVLLASNKALIDSQSPTAIASLQRAMKNVMYNKANSNCMIGLVPGGTISYSQAPWETGLMIAQIVVGVLEVVGVIVLVRTWTKKEVPEAKVTVS